MSIKALGYLALTVALVAATAGYFNGLGKDKIAAAEQRNIELKAKVDALSKDSEAHKALADAAEQEIKDRDARIASLKAKRKPAPTATSLGTSAAAVEAAGPSDEAALADQIIEAQDEQIAALKVEVVELRAALDLKDKALKISEQRTRALEIARDARESAIKRNRWLGRLEGLVVGLGAGYVAGRVM